MFSYKVGKVDLPSQGLGLTRLLVQCEKKECPYPFLPFNTFDCRIVDSFFITDEPIVEEVVDPTESGMDEHSCLHIGQ
jgi:hypothetical protein